MDQWLRERFNFWYEVMLLDPEGAQRITTETVNNVHAFEVRGPMYTKEERWEQTLMYRAYYERRRARETRIPPDGTT